MCKADTVQHTDVQNCQVGKLEKDEPKTSNHLKSFKN